MKHVNYIIAVAIIAVLSCNAVKPSVQISNDSPLPVVSSTLAELPMPKKQPVICKDTLQADIAPKIAELSQSQPPMATDYRQLNIKWQRLTQRLLDSAMSRKQQNDSLLAELRGFRKETAENFKTSIKTSEMYGNIGGACMAIIVAFYVFKLAVFLLHRKALPA